MLLFIYNLSVIVANNLTYFDSGFYKLKKIPIQL